MSLANPDAWPPGMTFDFTIAISKVHDKLQLDFQQSSWFPALRSVLEGWFTPDSTLNDETWNDSEYSLMSVHILFLKTLWTKLFGIATGPTPWEPFCLHSNSPNTTEDIMIDPQPFFQHLLTSIEDEDFIEELAAGRYPCVDQANDQGENSDQEGDDDQAEDGVRTPSTPRFRNLRSRRVDYKDSEDEDSDCEPFIRQSPRRRQRRHEHYHKEPDRVPTSEDTLEEMEIILERDLINYHRAYRYQDD